MRFVTSDALAAVTSNSRYVTAAMVHATPDRIATAPRLDRCRRNFVMITTTHASNGTRARGVGWSHASPDNGFAARTTHSQAGSVRLNAMPDAIERLAPGRYTEGRVIDEPNRFLPCLAFASFRRRLHSPPLPHRNTPRCQ